MNEKQLLKLFLTEFLPPTGNNRKYPTNNFVAIYDSLYSIFSHYFGIKLEPEEVKEVLYQIYQSSERNMTEAPDPNGEKPERLVQAKKGDTIAFVSSYRGRKLIHEGPNLYFDIPPVELNTLRKSTKKMPPNTKPEVLETIQSARKRVTQFKNKLGLRKVYHSGNLLSGISSCKYLKTFPTSTSHDVKRGR